MDVCFYCYFKPTDPIQILLDLYLNFSISEFRGEKDHKEKLKEEIKNCLESHKSEITTVNLLCKQRIPIIATRLVFVM